MGRKYGEEFYKTRKSLGLVQKDISRVLGYKNPQFVSNVERGIGYFPIEQLRKLHAEFSFPISRLAKIHVQEILDKKRAEYKLTFPRETI